MWKKNQYKHTNAQHPFLSFVFLISFTAWALYFYLLLHFFLASPPFPSLPFPSLPPHTSKSHLTSLSLLCCSPAVANFPLLPQNIFVCFPFSFRIGNFVVDEGFFGGKDCYLLIKYIYIYIFFGVSLVCEI